MTKITLTRPLKIALIVLSGAFVGAGLLFLYMLRFTTYLGDDPSACVNCHIMQPYYATKAKAQAYIGLDMDGMRQKKAKFMDNIVPQWLSMARENGKLLEY